MEVAYKRFVRGSLTDADRAELVVVDQLAERLQEHLVDSAADIDSVHVHRAQSSAVQSIVARLLTEKLGFDQEVVLTPSEGFVTSTRPDFIFRLSDGRGVLAEVERGGTTTNGQASLPPTQLH